MSVFTARLYSSIECLEARIAPAFVYNYIDIDGDAVSVKVSKGVVTDAAFTLAPASTTSPAQLLKIDLNGNAIFKNANITVTAHEVNGLGNGKANIGYIKATGVDLGTVSVPGDLGRIEAGDYILSSPGIKYLKVDSLRSLPLDPALADPSTGIYDTVSHVQGILSKLVVRGDIANAGLSVDVLSKAIIYGNLIGNNDSSQPDYDDHSGQIYSNISIGSVTVYGDVRGGLGSSSGSIVAANGNIGSIAIGGSLVGGEGQFSGAIFATAKINSVKIKGDVQGGDGPQSGYISAGYIASNTGSINKLSIGGSVIGGNNNDSGEIFTPGTLNKLTIVGNLVGGSSNLAALNATGYVEALVIYNASIGGIVSGVDSGVGLIKSGSIRGYDGLGKIKIVRDIVGNATTPVIISGFGAPIVKKTDVAIGSVTVGGSMIYGEILAGYNPDNASNRGTPLNGDAQIGKVTIAGNMVASSIIAGLAATDDQFGNSDDVAVSGTVSTIYSTIGRLVVGGQAYGSGDATDSATYGVGAQQLGYVKIGGVVKTFVLGPSNDTYVAGKTHASGPTEGTTNADGFDFHLYEVP